MGQRIKLKIAGREYPLEAASPEMERMMRLAASDVNKVLERFDAQFPEAAFEDKLVFAAIQEGVGKFYAQKRYSVLEDEVNSLGEDLAAYLKGMEKE